MSICDDIDCGMDTVDGYLCGSYTNWGCGKKYTTCDSCDGVAIEEGDLSFCEDCGNSICDECYTECKYCETVFCYECLTKCDHCDDEMKNVFCDNCFDDHTYDHPNQ